MSLKNAGRSADALDMKMTSYACVFAIAAVVFAGCGGGDTQDMTKFNTDFAKYMKKVAVKEGGELYQLVEITATCTPAENDKAKCDVVIRGPKGNEEKATAENVRREGNKFVWDRES